MKPIQKLGTTLFISGFLFFLFFSLKSENKDHEETLSTGEARRAETEDLMTTTRNGLIQPRPFLDNQNTLKQKNDLGRALDLFLLKPALDFHLKRYRELTLDRVIQPQEERERTLALLCNSSIQEENTEILMRDEGNVFDESQERERMFAVDFWVQGWKHCRQQWEEDWALNTLREILFHPLPRNKPLRLRQSFAGDRIEILYALSHQMPSEKMDSILHDAPDWLHPLVKRAQMSP